ncbi:MAG: PAS domain-containing protein, partial [Phycisphaerales bacterium]|nr:PAS domain-containing protein [Phycisphaerales bacterium]
MRDARADIARMVNTWTWLLTGVLIGGAGVWAWWSRRRVMHAPKADLRGVSTGVQGVLDAVPAHVAVLDARGTILATNRAWDDFGKIGGGVASVIGVGANYLDVCRRAMASEPCGREGGGTSEATPPDSCAAGDVYRQLVAVLEGKRDAALVPYPCHAPDREQWFQMRASVLRSGQTRAERLVLVSHEDITLTTQQRLAERGQ